jgi:hypothetical protein
MGNKKYTREFMSDAVAMYKDTRNFSEVSRVTGVSRPTLMNWVENDRIESGVSDIDGYDILDWLISKLPQDGRWTWTERNKWTNAYVAILDMTIEQVDEQRVGFLDVPV